MASEPTSLLDDFAASGDAALQPTSLLDEFAASGDAALQPTRRVIIIGLNGRAELNGLEAQILPGIKRGSQPEDHRVPVQTTLTSVGVLVRLRNLTALSVGLDHLGRDGLYACFMRLEPASALKAKRVCRAWHSQLLLLIGNPDWQAARLPLVALCRASAWTAAALRLDRHPQELHLTCADWIEATEAEARTGVPASGLRLYPKLIEDAADAGDTTAVLRWLDEGGGHVDARGHSHGLTLLMIAAEMNHLPLMDLLLQRRASVDFAEREPGRGLTALMIAADHTHVLIVRRLLKAGADTTMKTLDYNQRDVLEFAENVNYEDTDEEAKEAIVQMLRAHKQKKTSSASSAGTTKKVFTPFGLLNHDRDEGALQYALRHGAPPTLVRTMVQQTMAAAENGEEEGEEKATAQEAVLPISFAVCHGASAEVLSILCAADKPAISSTDNNFTALHHACLARDPDAIRVLLDAAPEELSRGYSVEHGELANTPCSPLHLLARGPREEAKRLPRSQVDGQRAAKACELLLAAYPNEEERRRTLLECSNMGGSYEGGWPTKRTPLHLACEYCAPPPLILKLLGACSEAAATADEHGWLPCHSIAGQDATEASETLLAALLAAYPPSPEMSLKQLLRLGAAPGAEAATLARLGTHPHEASAQDPAPPPPTGNGNPVHQYHLDMHARRVKHARYPLHHAAAYAAPRRVVQELIRLCPEAVRKQTSLGEYPLHLATRAAADLFQGVYGEMLRREAPSKATCTAAADCVELLLAEWPAGATACDKLNLAPGCSPRRQSDGYGWWALHTALCFRAPESVLEALRNCTPVDAFGFPTRPNPGRRGATKSNYADVRKLLHDDARTHQLRFFCAGTQGAPPGLRWTDRDHWGMPLRDAPGGWRVELTGSAVQVDPSKQDVASLEPYRDEGEDEEGEDEEEEPEGGVELS